MQFNVMYSTSSDFQRCSVIQFQNGSIVVSYAIMFSSNTTHNISSIEEAIYEELQNPSGAFSGLYRFDSSSLYVQGTLSFIVEPSCFFFNFFFCCCFTSCLQLTYFDSLGGHCSQRVSS